MMIDRVRILCSLVLALAGSAVVTMAQEEDLAATAAALAPRAEGLIVARCTVCHSADLIVQQRLPEARWQATIDKMRHWGADLSRDEAELLVRYLSARYHPAAPPSLPALGQEPAEAQRFPSEPVADAPLTGVPARGADLFAFNCQACHGMGATGGMGPRLAQNPILKHEDMFWDTVLYGRGPMPAWASALSEQDIADIHAWLLTK